MKREPPDESKLTQEQKDIFVLLRVMLSHPKAGPYYAKQKRLQEIVQRYRHLFDPSGLMENITRDTRAIVQDIIESEKP